jgi:hypothetical protein
MNQTFLFYLYVKIVSIRHGLYGFPRNAIQDLQLTSIQLVKSTTTGHTCAPCRCMGGGYYSNRVVVLEIWISHSYSSYIVECWVVRSLINAWDRFTL